MNKNREIKFIYIIVIAVFGIFLLLPIGSLLIQSFYNNGGLTLNNYLQTYQTTGFMHALKNSFVVSGVSALVTVILAFIVAYTLNYTNMFKGLKRILIMFRCCQCCCRPLLMDLQLSIRLENKGCGQSYLVFNYLIYMVLRD